VSLESIATYAASALGHTPRLLAYFIGLVLALSAPARIPRRTARAVAIVMGIGVAATIAGVAQQIWMVAASQSGVELARIAMVIGVLGMARGVIEAGLVVALAVIALHGTHESRSPQ
jgi:hypothetical protein